MSIKNILFVNNFSTDNTGSPKSILGIMNFLPKDKYHPIMMLNSEGPLLDRANELGITAHVRNMPELSKYNVFKFIINVYKDIKFLRTNKVKLIHVNYVGWRDSIVLAGKILKLPIVLHCRNEPVNPTKVSSSWNISFANKIITVSKKTKELLNLLPNDYEKAIPIYNAIEVDTFSNSVTIRKEFDLNEADFVVGIIGQLSKRKGLKNFIEMAHMVSCKNPNVKFLVVGEPPKGAESFSKEMKAYAAELGVDKNIIYTGQRNDAQNIMRSIDVLTVPSFSEPFARVILEAMATGLCVVGSDVSGIPEAIQDGITGIIVPPGNSEKLKEAINTLIQKPELLKSMGKEAYKRAKTEFDMPVLIRKIDELYSSLL